MKWQLNATSSTNDNIYRQRDNICDKNTKCHKKHSIDLNKNHDQQTETAACI